MANEARQAPPHLAPFGVTAKLSQFVQRPFLTVLVPKQLHIRQEEAGDNGKGKAKKPEDNVEGTITKKSR